MSVREQLTREIWDLPEEALKAVRDFVLFELKRTKLEFPQFYPAHNFEQGFERFMKYRGKLKRDLDYKKELTEARDEKYLF